MSSLTAHDFTVDVTSRDAQSVQYEIRCAVTCPRDGYDISLEPTNEGIIPQPESAVLAMVVGASDAGPEVITEESVHYSGSDGAELRTITIRLGDVRTTEGEDAIRLDLPSPSD